MESQLTKIIEEAPINSVKDLYKMRTDILETINAEIKRKKKEDKDKKNKKKKIVRPRIYISDSSSDDD